MDKYILLLVVITVAMLTLFIVYGSLPPISPTEGYVGVVGGGGGYGAAVPLTPYK